MIVYPTWPCSYQEPKPVSQKIQISQEKLEKKFSSQKTFSFDNLLEKLISLDNLLTSSDLKTFLKSYNSQDNQPSLFDYLLEQESAVIPEDSNPFFDMYQNLCELKVPMNKSSYVESKALLHKDILDSYYPNDTNFSNINLYEFEEKFNIPKGKILFLDISELTDSDYCQITMQKLVDVDQIIF